MTSDNENRFHHYKADVSHLPLPTLFTYPFCYKPHELSVLAAEEVKAYLAEQVAWHDELAMGKMFGVLVVENEQKQVGFIAAFSCNTNAMIFKIDIIQIQSDTFRNTDTSSQ